MRIQLDSPAARVKLGVAAGLVLVACVLAIWRPWAGSEPRVDPAVSDKAAQMRAEIEKNAQPPPSTPAPEIQPGPPGSARRPHVPGGK